MMLSPRYIFDNYVTTTSNKVARAACLSFAKSIHPPYNPLFLSGPTSVGKTHLLHAIGNRVRSLTPYAKVILATAEEMMDYLFGAISEARMSQFFEKYARADLLLIDDVDILVGKEKSQEAFLRCFNGLIVNGGRLALAGLKPMPDMPIFSKANMGKGLILTIKSPSRQEAGTILSRRFAAAAPPVPKSFIKMATDERFGLDVRRAEGLVKQMVFADSPETIV